MKKKLVALVASFSVLSICATAVGVSLAKKADSVKGTLPLQSMTLDSASDVYEIDSGVAHQVDIKNNKFDIVGYQAVASKFGSIKKATYGSYDYNGMIYNRSVINGFEYLTVNFGDVGNLYYTFTDFLMEDMSFDQSHQLTSGEPVAAEGKAYFVVYNTSTTPVEIESLTVEYYCDASIDAGMILNKDSTIGNARSYTPYADFEDSFVALENNPTKTTNNYSVGKTSGHSNNDSWYRWNGRFLADSEGLGTEFTFGLTIVGDYSRMIDDTTYFHNNVWPQFGWKDGGGTVHTSNNSYAQTYIGNDNYEPLGAAHALHPSDPYIYESYPGRFFTDYAGFYSIWDNNLNAYEAKYFETREDAQAYIDALGLVDTSHLEIFEDAEFLNPDTNTVYNGTKTFREAYETYTLPFWFIKFHVYLEDDEPIVDVYINGFQTTKKQQLFSDYDKVNKPTLVVHTMPMHLVNYGLDAEGNVDETCKYHAAFTYPRLIA